MRPHNTHSYTLSVCSVSLSWLPITIVLAMVLLFLVLLTRLGTTNPYHTDCLMFTNIYISTICLSTFLPPTCFSVISVNCISCVTIFFFLLLLFSFCSCCFIVFLAVAIDLIVHHIGEILATTNSAQHSNTVRVAASSMKRDH